MIYKPKGRRYYMLKFMWRGQLIRKSTRATCAKDARSIEGRVRSELARGNWDVLEAKPAPARGPICSATLTSVALHRELRPAHVASGTIPCRRMGQAQPQTQDHPCQR